MISAIECFINLGWLYTGLFWLCVLTTIGTIAVILSENRSPVKSLAWVTVLILLPVVGLIIYLFFGRSIKNVRMISRRNRRKLRKRESFKKVKFSKLDLTQESIQQIQLSRTLNGAIYYPGNTTQIFPWGSEMFEKYLEDLENAQQSINLQFYIVSDDNIGQKVKEILIRKAKSGVIVRFIYDHVGSFGTSGKYFKELSEAGVQVFPFFKVAFPPFGTRINWRNHRKITIIDSKIGYIGGMNLADRYIDGGKTFDCWRDTHIRIQGPAVGGLQFSFAVDWNFMGQPLLEDPKNNKDDLTMGEDGMQLLTSGPTSQWTNIAMLFIKAIANANRRVFIQTPYFLPNEGLLKAMQTASLSGVDVRIMIPRHSDSKMLDAATHSYFVECLQAGIKIYLYEKGMLHAKTMIVDDEFSSIGSTNFDFRSFEHNFEANMQVYSKSVNAEMTKIFFNDLPDCTRIYLSEWEKRPFLKKATESIIRLLSPVL